METFETSVNPYRYLQWGRILLVPFPIIQILFIERSVVKLSERVDTNVGEDGLVETSTPELRLTEIGLFEYRIFQIRRSAFVFVRVGESGFSAVTIRKSGLAKRGFVEQSGETYSFQTA